MELSWNDGPHLRSIVTIRRDSNGNGIAEITDELVTVATVYFKLTHQTSGEFLEYIGSTDDKCTVSFIWKQVPSGDYEGFVTDIVYLDSYDPTLDIDNPDYFTK